MGVQGGNFIILFPFFPEIQGASVCVRSGKQPSRFVFYLIQDRGSTQSIAFHKCKIKLERLLGIACSGTAIEKAGNLLYCSNRGI